jgi:hypothetical protein
MNIERNALWDRLRAAAIVDGEMPIPSVSPSPWYVRAMVGVAGWVAALLVFGFIGIGLSSLLNSPLPAILTGLVLCGLAAAALNAMAQIEFAVQFAFATSLAGQAAVAVGLHSLFRGHEGPTWLVFAVFESALVLAIAYPVHRVWSTLAAAVALLVALHQWNADFMFPALVAAGFASVLLGEAHLAGRERLLHPVGAGLAVALLAFVPSAILTSPFAFGIPHTDVSPYRWIGAASMATVLAATVGALLGRRHIAVASRIGITALALSVVLSALAWEIPAVVAGVMLVLVAFECGNRPLIGVGLLAIGGVLSYYYYSLQATLLAKSLALLTMGAIVLLAWYALRRWSPVPAPGEDHA